MPITREYSGSTLGPIGPVSTSAHNHDPTTPDPMMSIKVNRAKGFAALQFTVFTKLFLEGFGGFETRFVKIQFIPFIVVQLS